MHFRDANIDVGEACKTIAIHSLSVGGWVAITVIDNLMFGCFIGNGQASPPSHRPLPSSSPPQPQRRYYHSHKCLESR